MNVNVAVALDGRIARDTTTSSTVQTGTRIRYSFASRTAWGLTAHRDAPAKMPSAIIRTANTLSIAIAVINPGSLSANLLAALKPRAILATVNKGLRMVRPMQR